MTQYLRKHGTSEIFIRTDQLAERPDMVPYEPPIEASQKEGAAADLGLGSFLPDVGDMGKKQEVIAPDPNNVTAIVEAMAVLEPEDFTKDGKPKIPALTAILGWKPTMEEREAALESVKGVVDLPKGTDDEEAEPPAGNAQG